MRMPIDIHTHHLPLVSGEAIVNCYPDAFAPQEGGWYSVGVHPWYIDVEGEVYSAANHISAIQCEMKNRLSEEVARNPQVLAIGEAGLDKLATASLALQMEVFEHQARLAMKVDKPLVIHLVKATDELLRLKRLLHPSNPWIIHGFRGKAALAEVFLKHGFYLSFGEKYQAEALRVTPAERLFVETDDAAVCIGELYRQAAMVRGIAEGELCEAVRRNIRQVFFRL